MIMSNLSYMRTLIISSLVFSSDAISPLLRDRDSLLTYKYYLKTQYLSPSLKITNNSYCRLQLFWHIGYDFLVFIL